MSTITFDTLKFAERLEKAGFSREQSAALAEAQKESLAEAMDTQLATRSDTSAIRLDIQKMDGEIKLIKWMLGAMLGIGLTTLFKLFS